MHSDLHIIVTEQTLAFIFCLDSLSLSLSLSLSAETWLLWWLHREGSSALLLSASHYCEGDALEQAADCQREVLQQQISINSQRASSQWQHHT